MTTHLYLPQNETKTVYKSNLCKTSVCHALLHISQETLAISSFFFICHFRVREQVEDGHLEDQALLSIHATVHTKQLAHLILQIVVLLAMEAHDMLKMVMPPVIRAACAAFGATAPFSFSIFILLSNGRPKCCIFLKGHFVVPFSVVFAAPSVLSHSLLLKISSCFLIL